MLVGVKPSGNYLLVATKEEFLIYSEEYAKENPSREARILRSFSGSRLLNLGYLPPYPGRSRFVVVNAEDLVRSGEGTGILHLAPACGPEDFLLAQHEGVEVSGLIDEKGNFPSDCPVSKLAGVFYQQANR